MPSLCYYADSWLSPDVLSRVDEISYWTDSVENVDGFPELFPRFPCCLAFRRIPWRFFLWRIQKVVSPHGLWRGNGGTPAHLGVVDHCRLHEEAIHCKK
jgi:hypothetical protein